MIKHFLNIYILTLYLLLTLMFFTCSTSRKPPLSYFSVFLGIVSLSALVLFASGTYLGLGKGGMERMVAYPALLWVVGFGCYQIGYSTD